jgi:nucleoid-associated protein YgaU
MPRCLRSTLVVFLTLAAWNRSPGQQSPPSNSSAPYLIAQQDMATNAPDAGAATSSAQTGDEVNRLQAENAALRKEVADAARTIAELQAKLVQAGANHPGAPVPAEPPPSPPTPDAVASPDTGAPASPAPTGPQRALPLDATNTGVAAANANGAAADAGPSRSYTVVKGDSLWRISHKMYPHDTLNGEDKIRDANKDVFNGKFLQPGQVLVIPQ